MTYSGVSAHRDKLEQAVSHNFDALAPYVSSFSFLMRQQRLTNLYLIGIQ